MNEEQLKQRVAELSVKVAAQAGGTLTMYEQQKVWRTCRPMILDEDWGVEWAVTCEVHRLLHVTVAEPWSGGDSDQGWSTTSDGATGGSGQAPSTSDPRGALRFTPPAPPRLDRATLREMERLLAERLAVVEAYGPGCQICRNAEASAFLAKIRAILREAA